MDHHLLYVIFFCIWTAKFPNTAIMLKEKFKTNPYCNNYVINATETYHYLAHETMLKCAALCSRNEICSSFNYLKATSECRLNRKVLDGNCSNANLQSSSLYFEKTDQGCLNGGVRVPAFTGDCVCVNSYVGKKCERLMYDCRDGMSQYEGKTGIYSVRPIGVQESFKVKCLMLWGGRTILSINIDSEFHFNKTWQEAVDGYGGFDSQHYWVGLRKIYLLTKNLNCSFCQQIHDPTTLKFMSNCYKNFRIDDEAGQFKILYFQPRYNTFPKCFDNMTGVAFSTYDNDNDNATGRNCALEYGTHWWFGENCSKCNPLGTFTNPKGQAWTGDVNIVHWVGLSNTPRSTKMWME